ncbi:hypothetical protein AYI68_g6901 [Smittium mucronatum]|uniref:Uncharacterized protein n=1 Tax=Smittium mucronatum TaxID=133383 RepID=A0A1R0GQ81_9FUNG|nr:hypothetical protein AYI68_g6901 [Smittium mucronatum]
MGMSMRNHELVESGAYPYRFSPEFDDWRQVAKDSDSDVSASISIYPLNLSEKLEPSVNLERKTVMDDLVSSLLGLSLIFGPNPQVRFLLIIPTMGAFKHLVLSIQGAKGEL